MLVDISDEAARLSERHAELWDIFNKIDNPRDDESVEQFLADEVMRASFYTKYSAFNRTMGVAVSSVKFMSETPPELLDRYQRDLVNFQSLRVKVKRRYADQIDCGEFESRVQKLIGTSADSSEGLQILPLINIFEIEKFNSELENLAAEAAKADTIAYRTKKTIVEKIGEDENFYRRCSKSLDELIEGWRDKRISDADYLNTAIGIMNSVRDRTGHNIPDELQNSGQASAFFGIINDALARYSLPENVSVRAALKIDKIIQENIVVNWTANQDVQNQMKNQIEDYLYAMKEFHGIGLRPDEMDIILDRAIEIAKTRYSQ